MAGPKGSKYYDVFLEYNVCLNSRSQPGEVGDDLIGLLKGIRETNSISAAAKRMKISYRKAWGDIKTAEQFLNIPLVEASRGGSQGGESHLSADAEELVNAFDQLHAEFDEAIYKVTKRFFHQLNHQPPA